MIRSSVGKEVIGLGLLDLVRKKSASDLLLSEDCPVPLGPTSVTTHRVPACLVLSGTGWVPEYLEAPYPIWSGIESTRLSEEEASPLVWCPCQGLVAMAAILCVVPFFV